MSPSRPSARPSGGSATLPEAAGESEIPAKGSTVDRYVVLDELGRGGMGVVLAAFDPKLDRKVALKLLRMGSSDEGQARLQREAQALARLAHRHVVRVHDVGRHDGRVFVAMELIAGRTLGQWLRDVRPGWRQILPMFTAAAEGLAAAHAAGLVHRDFKPSNVLVGDDGQVKVTDFGLARVHADAPSILDSLGDQAADLETGPSGALALEATLTRTGALAGTPAYMAPEQLDGRAADPRSDQFSFCVSLFEALAGQRPFPGSTPWAVAESIEAQRYGTSLPGSIPRPLRSALRRGLQADPAARYPDMAALLAALHHGRKARRRQGVALLATALAGGGLWWASTEQQTPETPDYCAQVGERMEGIWDDAVRTEVEQAFTATQLAYAADTYDRIRVRVDSQAFAWVEAQRAACTAEASLPADVEPRQRDALDRTMVCLHRRFSELRQLSLLLREADAKLVERSPVVLDALGPVAACAEAKASPLDPRGSEALEQAEALAAIEMFQEAGRYEEAVEAANTAVEQAKGYSRAAQAVASHARARALDAAGKRDDTERDYHEAFSAAVASGHHVVALQSAIGLAVLMSSGRKPRFDEATLWTDHAEGALERHGGGDEYRGRIANIRGQIEHRRGHYPEALVHFQNAIDLRMADLGPDSYRMANYHNNIGHTLAELERRDEALEHQLRSLALETEHYGDRHPRVASAMAALGSTYSDAGKIDQALSYSTRAVSLLRETVGEDHPNLGTALINLGTAQVRGGKFELAERSFLDALKNAEAVFGPDHRRVGLVLNNLGVHYEMTGQLAEAER
ncbi:MAG: tetratricopeptide repeat protein, partial [Deltaproteobacteria bacterium]|nr:tetratricopeptide repeat protein [Deltaproteobacteria bacterium]